MRALSLRRGVWRSAITTPPSTKSALWLAASSEARSSEMQLWASFEVERPTSERQRTLWLAARSSQAGQLASVSLAMHL